MTSAIRTLLKLAAIIACGLDGVAALKRMSEYGHLIFKEINYRV